MEFLRYILWLSVILVAVPLVSCIDGREEIWLNADGSGRADVAYELPAVAAKFQGGEAGVRKIIGEFLAKASGLTSHEHEVTTDGDRLKIRVRASFSSVRDMKRIANKDPMKRLPPSAGNLAGDVVVGIDGRTVDFRRTISPGKALPGSSFMPASQFKNRRLVYIIHLPEPIESSNAMVVEDGGKTLKWDFPLAQAIKHPVTTSFKVKVPIPTWMIVSAVAGLLVLAGAVFLVIRMISSRVKR